MTVRASEDRRAAAGSGEPSDEDIRRAIGEELRRAREALGLSRVQLVAGLRSGIGDRTLLSYEHGSRHISVLRWIEISRELAIPAPVLLARGLQRARLYVENMPLTVDLRFLLNDRSDKFRPMHQWARNTLNQHPAGVVEVEPSAVRHLALFVGCTHSELARFLARFIPEDNIDYQETVEGPE